MTAPTAKAVDPSAATSSAEDSATGFDLALYADKTTATAYHQGVVPAYIDADDEAQHVSATYPMPVIDVHPAAARADAGGFTTGSVAVVAGDYLGKWELTSLADNVAIIYSVCLSWSTALWPADAEVDLYCYNSTFANTGWSGAVGDPFTAPVPSAANGALVARVRLTNECAGTAFSVVATPFVKFHQTAADITWIAVYAAGTGFTTATPLTLSVTAEVQP